MLTKSQTKNFKLLSNLVDGLGNIVPSQCDIACELGVSQQRTSEVLRVFQTQGLITYRPHRAELKVTDKGRDFLELLNKYK